MEFLSRVRLEHSKALLRRSDTNIIDNAFECGYSSSQYFANIFKHTTGMTPSIYQKKGGKLSTAEAEDWKNIKFRSEKENWNASRYLAI